jgi:hypothetical protein
MRLINCETYQLQEFFEGRIPPYAILSHTWEDEEVSYLDMADLEKAKRMKGFFKIEQTCKQALRMGFRYAWVDTCKMEVPSW